MDYRASFTIPNRISDIKHLCGSVQNFVTGHGVAPETAQVLDLALDEFVSNVIKYAYEDDDEHVITVRLHIETAQVWMEIEDDGREFDPREAPEPDLSAPLEERQIGGLGVYLVRQMSREMTYRRIRETNRSRICIAR